MGGLVIKETLSIAGTVTDDEGQGKDDNMKLFLSCYSLLLFGVPNKGLKHPLLVDIVKERPNAQLIQDLLVDEDGESKPFIKALDMRFQEKFTFQDAQVLSFFERHLSATAVRSTWLRPF